MILLAVLQRVPDFLANGIPPGSRTTFTDRPAARNRSSNRAICVVFPQPSVPSNVINNPLMQFAILGRRIGLRRDVWPRKGICQVFYKRIHLRLFQRAALGI